jgi:hypothetical protein
MNLALSLEKAENSYPTGTHPILNVIHVLPENVSSKSNTSCPSADICPCFYTWNSQCSGTGILLLNNPHQARKQQRNVAANVQWCTWQCLWWAVSRPCQIQRHQSPCNSSTPKDECFCQKVSLWYGCLSSDSGHTLATASINARNSFLLVQCLQAQAVSFEVSNITMK